MLFLSTNRRLLSNHSIAKDSDLTTTIALKVAVNCHFLFFSIDENESSLKMEKSLEKLKLIERISRQTRHHRTFLNQISDQKLREELNHLNDQYEQSFIRSKSQQKIERQRKQVLDLTIQQIVRERQSHLLSTNTPQIEQVTIQKLPKDTLDNRPSSSIKLPTPGTSCRLFSRKCQLYPCKPLHHYSSFIKKEHDQTIGQRNITPPSSPVQTRPQLSITLRNQYHLANRHVFMERTKGRLDEQSRLLHERLTNRKIFDYTIGHKHELNQAIQRHLQNSAKFCA